MTTVRHLKALAGAGDVDPALAFRIDVVAAAGKVYEATQRMYRCKRRDCLDAANDVDNAVSELVIMYGRYKAALAKRQK